MDEDKNGVQNGTPNGDMPPQEASQKSPLTGEETPEAKPEIKSKDDTKLDIAAEEGPAEDEQFQGLTKEDLMKYSQDPFWKRLRIFLMLLFWAGWIAMLVIAILIIIQAPQCEPLPSLQWVQEAPILQVDINSHSLADITTLMGSLGLTSFYFPALISQMDYKILNTITANNVAETLRDALEALSAQNVKSVTDYVPNPVHSNHPWVDSTTYPDVLDSSFYLNYNNSDVLVPALQDVFEFWKSEYNVTGFLVSESEVQAFPLVLNTTADLNAVLEPQDIAVSTSTMDLQSIIDGLDTPGTFKNFLMENIEDWHYYLFNPLGEAHKANTPDRMSCVTLSLMALPCTPVMQVSNLTAFEQQFGAMVRQGIDLRTKNAIQFGETQFANTTDNVIAYSRTRKGFPGYAVVINLGTGENKTETVNFSELPYVPDSGELVYSLTPTDVEGAKVPLEAVEVAPHQGKVILFVADF